jgi:hypothetical protein
MSILLNVFSQPEQYKTLSTQQWQDIICQASASQLLGRLTFYIDRYKIDIPSDVEWHLRSAEKIANKQRLQTVREFHEVTKALPRYANSLVFLKGSAYIAKDLPCAYGRTFSDIDILVPKTKLNAVERTLKFSDWLKTEIDDYDEKYYRTWMHEIPPLTHAKRGTVLDIHHNILPPTNKYSPQIEKFHIEKTTVEGVGEINTLDDFDLCIHTAVHLFTESEFHHGLRDMSDIDMLLRHFQQKYQNDNDGDFIALLINRSKELGLFDYTRLAIRYAHLVFKSPLGSYKLSSLTCSKSLLGQFEDFCFINIFKPEHSSCRDWKTVLATHFLYWRGHLIRMPLRLLAPHLARKTWKSIKDIFTKEENPNENMIP